MDKKYGYFSKNGNEFIITRPDTPRPWLNYFSNENYAVRFSQTGSGFSIYGKNNHTQVNYFDPHDNLPGRIVYIRDNDSGDYWTINWHPVNKSYQSFQCRHGLGYSVLR